MNRRHLLIACVVVLALLNLSGLSLITRNSDNEDALLTLAQFPTDNPTNAQGPQVVASQPSDVGIRRPDAADSLPEQPPLDSVSIEPPDNTLPSSVQDEPEPAGDTVALQFDESAAPDERIVRIESVGGTVQAEIAALNTVVVQIPQPGQVIAVLEQSSLVVASEPDYVVSALADIPVPTSDPYYDQQWGLQAIGAPEAWQELPDDAPAVTVAVIDSGVCYDHPDLAGRILTNGRDFIESDYVAQDVFGHGCGVAGVIAATIDNGVGIAGVAPNAQIMPLRVLDANGFGTTSNVALAIIYAVDNGAQVINLSLGTPNYSSVLEDAVNYAVDNGVILVAAAGNTGTAGVLYPAAYDPVIAVGAHDPDGSRSSFSRAI